jgi:hypothetical protein
MIVIVVSGGGAYMAHKTLEEVLEEAVQKLMADESTVSSIEPYRYAKTIFAAFDKIQALRKKGIRRIKICKAFEESGLLPQNANSRCFCQAFRREKARRGKSSGSSVTQAEKPERDEAINAVEKMNPEQAAAKLDATSRKERTKQLTGTVVDSGLGKIIKHSDGSFEY